MSVSTTPVSTADYFLEVATIEQDTALDATQRLARRVEAAMARGEAEGAETTNRLRAVLAEALG